MARTKSISDADLLKAARQVFVEKGFAASTREIARQAGISEGVLFQRFHTKDDLFFAAMLPPPVDLSGIFSASDQDGLTRLHTITAALTQYFRETLPVLIPLMSHRSFKFEEFAQRHPDSPMVTLRRDIVLWVIAEQRAGRIGNVDPGATALAIWSVAHTITFFERMGAHGGKFEDRILRATVECLWKGMSPQGGG
ncbi:MAG: TetR/AcrR family transcriptional regulator [Acidobacteriia bacterium]|nr:TetR/AcrR family transcriptional regulator [Terriglobia bacterium]